MGYLLLLPFFLIRFILLSLLNKKAVKRAAYFAPLLDKEKPMYWLYQVSNLAVIVCISFLKIRFTPIWLLYAGLGVYISGMVLLTVSVADFSAPSENGFNRNGIYKLSRNPMYIAYFIFFIGCVLITQSPILLAFVLLFQISTHWIIISEERWCIEQFGKEYLEYMENVRRYI